MSVMSPRRTIALAFGFAFGINAALAQTTGTPIEVPPVPLPPEKQLIVKDYVARSNPPLTVVEALAVGATVPETTELFALPQDTVTEVPSVTRYKFLRTKEGIAVIDPETRKVIQTLN